MPPSAPHNRACAASKEYPMHLAVAFLAFSVTFAITTLCVAWSPFAALICARIARRRGLSAKRLAVHGAIYSALLFFPWRHLTRQMRGEPITRANIDSAYFFAYLLAALVATSHVFLIFAELIQPRAFYSLEDMVEHVVATIAGALAFAAGLASLSRAKNRLNELQEQRESPNAIDLPDKSYIAPFAWAWATMLISSAPYYYRFIAVLIWTSFIDR